MATLKTLSLFTGLRRFSFRFNVVDQSALPKISSNGREKISPLSLQPSLKRSRSLQESPKPSLVAP